MTETPIALPAETSGVALRRRSFVLVAAVVVLLAVAGLTYVLTRPTPLHVFGEHGDTVEVPVPAGRAIYADMGVQSRTRLHIDSVDPAVVANSARATFRVLLCHVRAGQGLVGAGYAADLRQSYDSVGPFRAGDYVLYPGAPDQLELMVEVTPTQPGVVKLAGFHVRYHQGDRHGDEQSGIDITIHASQP